MVERAEREGKSVKTGVEKKIETMDKDNNKKTKVYECTHFEYEYDDLGKYCWCHSKKMHCRECPFESTYAQIVCPGYEKGEYRGEWEIRDWEKKEAEDFLHKLAAEQKDIEEAERALYEQLKKKYG